MMRKTLLGPLVLAAAGLSGCANGLDPDLRGLSGGFETATAAQVAKRPDGDARGVISYPSYQVALARSGETVAQVAGRLGLQGEELARYNGLTEGTPLREGELLALPRRVAAAAPAARSGDSDIRSLASSAIERSSVPAPLGASGSTPVTGGRITTSRTPAPVGAAQPAPRAAQAAPAPAAARPAPKPSVQPGPEPLRHRVVRGETAYSIARLYNVPVRSLADWNNLGPQLGVREGQVLLVPASAGTRVATAPDASAPGRGSATPTPPSASQPLPKEAAAPVVPPAPKLPPQTAPAAVDSSKMLAPVKGSIIRPYSKGRNDGIDIAAQAGTSVRAAASGEVAAITRDTEQVPILVLRHPGNLLTVYANIAQIKVKKGDTVKRGETLAQVRNSDPSFVHFEVRKGFESVDPEPYLQ